MRSPNLNELEFVTREGNMTENMDPSGHKTIVERLINTKRHNDAYIYIINNIDAMQNGSLQNEMWIKIGHYKFNNNKYEQALKMYNNMMNYDKYTDIIYLNMAYCYQHLNKAQESLTYYYKHLHLNSDDEYCMNNIAVLEYYSNQNYTKSLKMYHKMNRNYIIENKLYFNIAVCYFHAEQFENALFYFDKHLNSETVKNRNDCLISMALIYSNKLNDYCKALEMFHKLDNVVIFGRNLELEIAYNYQQTKQYKQALKYFILYLKKNPNDVNTLHHISRIYIQNMNDFDAAKPFLIKILHLNKTHFYANYAYGIYLRDTVKNYNLSIKCLQIAYNAKPGHSEILNDIIKTNNLLLKNA